MAYIRDGYRGVPHFDVDGGYGSWFSKAVSSVSAVVASVDPTSKRNFVGGILAPVARPVVATAKVAVGATLIEKLGSYGAQAVGAGKLASTLDADVSRTVPQAVVGYQMGAAFGMDIVTGKSPLTAAQSALTVAMRADKAGSAAIPATTAPVVAAPSTSPSPPAGGLGGPAAGAAGGFLVGGPVGAAIGAGLGFWITRSKQ